MQCELEVHSRQLGMADKQEEQLFELRYVPVLQVMQTVDELQVTQFIDSGH